MLDTCIFVIIVDTGDLITMRSDPRRLIDYSMPFETVEVTIVSSRRAGDTNSEQDITFIVSTVA